MLTLINCDSAECPRIILTILGILTVATQVGRKMVIGIGCIWFTVGSVVAATAYSVLLMGIARFIIGVGIGFETMVMTPISCAVIL